MATPFAAGSTTRVSAEWFTMRPDSDLLSNGSIALVTAITLKTFVSSPVTS